MDANSESRIVGSKRFRRAYKKLPPLKRRRTDQAIEKLAANPELPGLHVKPVKGASSEVRSCRVTHGIRLIFRIMADHTLQLLHVGEHDSAYRKAVSFWSSLVVAKSATQFLEEGDFAVFETEGWLSGALYERLGGRLDRADVPQDLGGLSIDVIETTLAEGTEGRAKASGQAGPINLIPSDVEGECHELLVAFCFDGDSFDNRLREVAYHAGIHCPNTRAVVLVTSKWNPRKWKSNHERAFADLDADVIILMAAFGRVAMLT